MYAHLVGHGEVGEGLDDLGLRGDGAVDGALEASLEGMVRVC